MTLFDSDITYTGQNIPSSLNIIVMETIYAKMVKFFKIYF